MSFAARQAPPPGALVLDHVAHFVDDLGAAGALLEALGFAVTPRSDHYSAGAPLGASNRCVMLESGYLEFLSPTHDTPHAQRLRALMARYPGVHLACFGTPDAPAEQRRLQAHGFVPQPLVDLEREVEGGAVARFQVVRPTAEAMPEGRVQYVRQVTPEHLWRPKYVAHANGVRSLDALYVVADDVPAAAARWARFAALLPQAADDGVVLETARGRVVIATREALSRTLGDAPPAPALAGCALGCRDAAAFAERCAAAGLAVRKNAGSFSVSLPPSLGGAWVLTNAGDLKREAERIARA